MEQLAAHFDSYVSGKVTCDMPKDNEETVIWKKFQSAARKAEKKNISWG